MKDVLKLLCITSRFSFCYADSVFRKRKYNYLVHIMMDWQKQNCMKMNRKRFDEFKTILIQFFPSFMYKTSSKLPSKLLQLKIITTLMHVLMANSFEAENLSPIDRIVLA